MVLEKPRSDDCTILYNNQKGRKGNKTKWRFHGRLDSKQLLAVNQASCPKNKYASDIAVTIPTRSASNIAPIE